jgi:predicted NAD/FAD-dependent oxidoreductase
MRLLRKSYARAFEFRRASAKLFETRVHAVWEEAVYEGANAPTGVGFEPVNLEGADIQALCAECAIDHSIGPVRHTPGGTEAGYARWERFKELGLKRYHQLRNDPLVSWPGGVSGLSPYLHHGHVSPFRIAREASENASEGANKFLDELFVWRELAHNFCFYRDDVETLEALPAWAQETLAAHRQDTRPSSYSWERLARGQTGDALWDAAQKSLLVHGELHNNVRMTWGKAFLEWTESSEEALRLMIDLNHRYAFDGNDPNSYGGLLYSLGLFDRPFTPERRIHGTLRTRSTAQHAQRLNVTVYRARVSRPAGAALRIAVVGAGMSGLFAARALADAGHEVAVFERGRGAGGRMATRRQDEYAFDHGAQYFTLKDARFGRYVKSWVQDGVVKPWQATLGKAKDGTVTLLKDNVTRYVGVPSMSALPRHLSSSLQVTYRTRVKAVEAVAGKWRLVTAGALESGLFDVVILAVTPQQAVPLLANVPALAAQARTVKLLPCWATLVTFPHTLELGVDGAFVDHPALAWISRNASKPERPTPESWVLHATSDWSSTHLTAPRAEVAAALLAAFFQATGQAPVEPLQLDAHRWGNALASTPLTVGCLWDGEARLGVCGDWCHASRVEGAFLSGMAVCGLVLGAASDLEEKEMEQRQLPLC